VLTGQRKGGIVALKEIDLEEVDDSKLDNLRVNKYLNEE
jgi:hypothetical protein